MNNQILDKKIHTEALNIIRTTKRKILFNISKQHNNITFEIIVSSTQ